MKKWSRSSGGRRPWEGRRRRVRRVKARRETLGNDHPDTVASLANSGMMLKEKGRLDEAEPLLREALEHMEAFRAGGDSDPKLLTELLICQANLGSLFKEK